LVIRVCIETDTSFQKLKEFIGRNSSILPASERGEADLAVSYIHMSMVCTHNHEIRHSVNWPPPTYTCQLKGLYARSKANKWTHCTQVGCAESGWGMLGYRLRSELGCSHKVLTYVEYRAGFGVFQNIDSPPPSPPSECVRPPHQRRGGTHSPGGKGVGGQYFGRRQT
jgi:hypothetical protein